MQVVRDLRTVEVEGAAGADAAVTVLRDRDGHDRDGLVDQSGHRRLRVLSGNVHSEECTNRSDGFMDVATVAGALDEVVDEALRC